MKILILTAFYSSTGGGVATVSRLLVRGFKKQNHEVMVLTTEADSDEFNEDVVSRPSFVFLIRRILASDAIIMQGTVLRLGWPLLVLKRKTLMVRHMAEYRTSLFRQFFSRRMTLATVSEFMASRELSRSFVLPNPYDDAVFYEREGVRNKDLLFVGRLIPGKGALTLLEVFLRLQKTGNYSLTIIGDGDQQEACELFVLQHGLSEAVSILGHLEPTQIAEQMRMHKVFVMPSYLEEAFGLVVVESLACGCYGVVSNRGGLPEALGELGMLYDPDDEDELCNILRGRLADYSQPLRERTEKHLAHYKPDAVVSEYNKLLFGGSK